MEREFSRWPFLALSGASLEQALEAMQDAENGYNKLWCSYNKTYTVRLRFAIAAILELFSQYHSQAFDWTTDTTTGAPISIKKQCNYDYVFWGKERPCNLKYHWLVRPITESLLKEPF